MTLPCGAEKRRALEDSLNSLGTEIHCLTHIHYVFSPLHFRSPESWKFRQQQEGVSIERGAALAKGKVRAYRGIFGLLYCPSVRLSMKISSVILGVTVHLSSFREPPVKIMSFLDMIHQGRLKQTPKSCRDHKHLAAAEKIKMAYKIISAICLITMLLKRALAKGYSM